MLIAPLSSHLRMVIFCCSKTPVTNYEVSSSQFSGITKFFDKFFKQL